MSDEPRGRWLNARLAFFLTLAVPLATAPAQRAATHSVEGIAYDSLAGAPLRRAVVTAPTAGRSVTTDDRGRFRLDSMPVGVQVITLQHSAFDSLGLSGTSARVSVRSGMPRVVLAVPSFASLWGAVCQSAVLPNTAIIFGTVRSTQESNQRQPFAVDGEWDELVGGGRDIASVAQRHWRLRTTTDSLGNFALCGVAREPELLLTLRRDSSATNVIGRAVVNVAQRQVQRHDFTVERTRTTPETQSPTAPSGATLPARSIIRGVIRSTSGQPVANATLRVDSLREVRTTSNGTFLVDSVAAGFPRVSVVAIGMQPYATTVALAEGDTAQLAITLSPVTTLASMKVSATNLSTRLRDIAERQRMGLGAMRDSATIKQYPSVNAVLRTMNGVRIVERSRLQFTLSITGCGKIDVRLDGVPSTAEDLALLDTRDIALIELYRRVIPSELQSNRGCPLMVWTKRGLTP